MSYRFMRTIVFFDLPTTTEENRRNYRKFHTLLVKNGFWMMQESVYCRMLINPTAGKAVLDIIRRNKPPEGIVQVLTVTEKQFSHMEYICGETHSEIISTDERLIEL